MVVLENSHFLEQYHVWFSMIMWNLEVNYLKCVELILFVKINYHLFSLEKEPPRRTARQPAMKKVDYHSQTL